MYDLLLVTPPSRLEVYQSLGQSFSAIEPPVWSGLIARFVQRHGYDVGILDAEALGLSHEQTAKEIINANPLLTVFVVYGQQPSASTQCMSGARKVAKLLPQSDLFSMVMGTHASALPERTLIEEPYTYVCRGEGPLTTLELIKHLKGECSIENVPGLWYYVGESPQHTPDAPLIADLDIELPGQTWDLLDMTRYRAHNWHCFNDLESRGRYASIQTSLGCPFKCSFCCINAPFGSPNIRFWSPKNIIEQITVLVEQYGITNLKLPDEMFVLNPRHVIGICDLIIERNFNLNIWAYARIDTLHDEMMLAKLRAAGFNWIGIGIESASEHVRDGIVKGKFGNTDILETIRRVRSFGFYVAANYIFGLPDDDFKSMRGTLDLALELNTEWANMYCAMAYPGSRLYHYAREKGWKLPGDVDQPDWIGYSQHSYDCLPLPTETLTSNDVLRFRDEAFREYFQNKDYINMIHRTFGKDVVAHIREMTTYHLPRRHQDEGKAIV